MDLSEFTKENLLEQRRMDDEFPQNILLRKLYRIVLEGGNCIPIGHNFSYWFRIKNNNKDILEQLFEHRGEDSENDDDSESNEYMIYSKNILELVIKDLESRGFNPRIETRMQKHCSYYVPRDIFLVLPCLST